MINGIPVENGVGHLNLDSNNNVVSTFDSFWKGVVPALPDNSSIGTPSDAVQALVDRFGGQGYATSAATVFSNDPAAGAKQVYMIDGDSLHLGWLLSAEVGDHVLSAAVDVVSGKVLQCIDLVSDTAAHIDEANANDQATRTLTVRLRKLKG